MSDDERAAVGRELQGRVFGRKFEALAKAMAGLDPDLPRWMDEFIFGEVWARDGLDLSERLLVAIVALTVAGKIDQLRNYLHGALNEEVPREKVQEALVMTCVYAGFPSAVNALKLWQDVQAAHDRAAKPA